MVIAVWGPREAHALREAMRLSIDDFATRIGVSRRGVAMWSTRETTKLRWDVQRKLDDALAAAPAAVVQRLTRLLDEHQPQAEPAAAVEPTESAIRALGELLVLPPPQAGTATRQPLIRLEQQVARARMAAQAAQYTQVVAQLPALAARLAQAAADPGCLFPQRVKRLTSAVYQIATGLLVKLGDLPLAMLAAQRSASEAEASGDPLIIAAGARASALVLQHCGHSDSALALARLAARELTAATGLDGPRPLSAHGALLLSAATAAARRTDPAQATRLLAQAADAARTLGCDGNFGWTAFGPTDVQLHRLDVLLELADPAHALRVCTTINPATIRHAERLARYHLASARAFHAVAQPGPAVGALGRAYAVAPQEVKLSPSTRQFAAQLAQTTRGPVKTRAARLAEELLRP